MPTDREARDAVAQAHHDSWATILATTVRLTRDLDLAQECVQEAYAAALVQWDRDGVPAHPAGWLATTARRRAVDRMRRESALRRRLPLLLVDDGAVIDDGGDAPALADRMLSPDSAELAVPDDRLRLIFLCCHPVLDASAQVALTLRLVCDVQTADIAAVFLVPTPTMAARITRAKRKITIAGVPLRMPSAAELPERLRAVLSVVHLVLTTGHTAPSGAAPFRVDLVDQAHALAAALHEMLPDEPEPAALLALTLLTRARRSTRVDCEGRLVPLGDQDRSRWDRRQIADAHSLVLGAMSRGPRGRYALQAAITALQVSAPSDEETDWPQILTLYDTLLDTWPNPVVALNRIVGIARVHGAQAALSELERLAATGALDDYRYMHATRGHLLGELGRLAEANAAYRRALELTDNDAEREFLMLRGSSR
jgi:Predicted RNA polymerase sigma factor containing a TPR repeat domain